jgi:hypothetical protein
MRNRIPELHTSSAVLSKEPDPRLSLLMAELVHAQNDLEWAVAVYEVLKPALLEAIGSMQPQLSKLSISLPFGYYVRFSWIWKSGWLGGANFFKISGRHPFISIEHRNS